MELGGLDIEAFTGRHLRRWQWHQSSMRNSVDGAPTLSVFQAVQ